MSGDDAAQEFGRTIKTLRKARKLSQEQLGMLVGVSRQTIGDWETSLTVVPTVVHLTELARHLRTSFAALRPLLARARRQERRMLVPAKTYRLMVDDYLQSALGQEMSPSGRERLYRAQSRAFARQYVHTIRQGLEEMAPARRRR